MCSIFVLYSPKILIIIFFGNLTSSGGRGWVELWTQEKKDESVCVYSKGYATRECGSYGNLTWKCGMEFNYTLSWFLALRHLSSPFCVSLALCRARPLFLLSVWLRKKRRFGGRKLMRLSAAHLGFKWKGAGKQHIRQSVRCQILAVYVCV